MAAVILKFDIFLQIACLLIKKALSTKYLTNLIIIAIENFEKSKNCSSFFIVFFFSFNFDQKSFKLSVGVKKSLNKKKRINKIKMKIFGSQ